MNTQEEVIPKIIDWLLDNQVSQDSGKWSVSGRITSLTTTSEIVTSLIMAKRLVDSRTEEKLDLIITQGSLPYIHGCIDSRSNGSQLDLANIVRAIVAMAQCYRVYGETREGEKKNDMEYIKVSWKILKQFYFKSDGWKYHISGKENGVPKGTCLWMVLEALYELMNLGDESQFPLLTTSILRTRELADYARGARLKHNFPDDIMELYVEDKYYLINDSFDKELASGFFNRYEVEQVVSEWEYSSNEEYEIFYPGFLFSPLTAHRDCLDDDSIKQYYKLASYLNFEMVKEDGQELKFNKGSKNVYRKNVPKWLVSHVLRALATADIHSFEIKNINKYLEGLTKLKENFEEKVTEKKIEDFFESNYVKVGYEKIKFMAYLSSYVAFLITIGMTYICGDAVNDFLLSSDPSHSVITYVSVSSVLTIYMIFKIFSYSPDDPFAAFEKKRKIKLRNGTIVRLLTAMGVYVGFISLLMQDEIRAFLY